MSAINLKSTRAAHAELLARRAKFYQKKRDCESLAANIASKLSGLEQAHSILEKRYLTDEVSLAQVTASRQELDAKRAELVEAERLAGLAAEAIIEIDQKINAATQSVRIARRDFCFQIRDSKLAEVKADKRLSEAILQAMAASAATGMEQYTNNATSFVQQFILQILPEINEQEVIAATEKFIKENGLD